MNLQSRFAGPLVGLLVGGAWVVAQTAQAPESTAPLPTFKAEVEYVEVDAVVADQQGRFVRNLTKDDFQVFEDGKRQTISNFSVVDIPIDRYERPLFAARPIDPDVQSNERPFDGRVYVMILDDLHVAALRSQRVKMAARQFIERNLGANDRMAVVFTGGRSQDAQEFTNNKRLLLASVDRFIGQKLQSATLARNDEFFRLQGVGAVGDRIQDPDEQQRAFNTRNMLTSLRQVAEWLGGIRGRRKTMLFFSEGVDYDLTDVIRGSTQPASQASSILYDIQDAITATVRANVSIYAIDPRGLTTMGDDMIGVESFADSQGSSSSNAGDGSNTASQAARGIGQRGLQNELWMSQNSLRQLSEETGGFAAVNRNDYATAFDRVVSDNSSYYVMAYYPPSDKRNGKFHRIEVKVNRPGATVRSRRGYASPRGKPAPQTSKMGNLGPALYEAISSPLPVSGLTIRAFATPFKGTQPNASILLGVELLGRDLSLDANSKVEMSYMAADAKTKVHVSRKDALTLNLQPETREMVKRSGIRMFSRFELPPGRYQLRVAASDSVKSGSVVYDLEVPDFFKQPLSMSGLAITSLGAGAMVHARLDEDLKEVMPAPPVAARTFERSDELALFAEVYDNSGNTPHKVDITTSVLTDEGRVLFKNEETRDSSELQGAKGGYGYAARVPLSEIAPGSYVLQVEAKSRLGNDAGLVRQVQFKIVAGQSSDAGGR